MRKHWLDGEVVPQVGWLLWIFVWALYAILTYTSVRSKTRLRFWFCYTSLCVLLVINANGCRAPSKVHRLAVYKSGIANLTPANQLNTHYQRVDNNIQQFGSGGTNEEWHTEAYIDGRFELVFTVRIEVNYSRWTVTDTGEPTFYLNAVEKIGIGSTGRVKMIFPSTQSWRVNSVGRSGTNS